MSSAANLYLLSNFELFKYRNKQRGPRSDCSYGSCLIGIYTVCQEGFKTLSADEIKDDISFGLHVCFKMFPCVQLDFRLLALPVFTTERTIDLPSYIRSSICPIKLDPELTQKLFKTI